MPSSPFSPQALYDELNAFPEGMNSNLAPLLLPKTQLAFGTNVTVRGTFVGPRAGLRKITLDFGTNTTARGILTDGSLWQGGQFYKPDSGNEQLAMVLGGRLFIVTPDPTLSTATVVEKTIAGDANPPTQPIAWLWQAENFLIWNDGLSRPVFYNGTVSVRSTGGNPVTHATTVATAFLTPAIGTAFTMNVASTAGMTAAGGDILTLTTGGQYLTTSVIDATHVAVVNQSAIPVNANNPVGRQVLWSVQTFQLPPGRMGCYSMGRNVMSLVDGKQFIISDAVGGSSGTQSLNFRDAVLNVTENTYLAGGGNFAVPGSIGDVRAIVSTANLDASLGQGPALVITPFAVFSLNLPADRLTWQNITNPILAVSALANGGLGQNSSISVNSDTIMRAVDGIRSLKLARQDFNQWGSPPISVEMDRVLPNDITTLLRFSSAVQFDNRMLMTCVPQAAARGAIFRGLIALNLDPISSLRGKAESVYDGLWTGLDILQIVKGEFSFKERCFAFTMNQVTQELELYEILTSVTAQNDYIEGGTTPITWSFETPALFNEFQKSQSKPTPLRLTNGEIYIDSLIGRADFTVYYKKDASPCWTLWKTFSVCNDPQNPAPGYRWRLGLGEPPASDCDTLNNIPMRNGFTFQTMFVVTGYCSVKRIFAKAITIPEPEFAQPAGCCPGETGQ